MERILEKCQRSSRSSKEGRGSRKGSRVLNSRTSPEANFFSVSQFQSLQLRGLKPARSGL
ncbi:hypothetical protein ASPCADRAFT_208557, partial [Aspergillus carbonarius ITEM 5010]